MEQLTPEAKAAVMQLMGQTYGLAKKQDDMLVSASGNLKPKSNELKSMVENLVQTPVSQSTQPSVPVQPSVPATTDLPVTPAQVTPEQAISELNQITNVDVDSQPQVTYPLPEEQMLFNFEPDKIDLLISAVKESNLLLKDIKLQLETNNARPKRKSAKAKITD
jgi:hypothetical protein